ncbi:hypothetical protein B0H19DRAFT_1255169 [Mycena capillaripes]|nr:hypothetical protein B0H19DRAFT_1255169 [Mycena capillaripes]
MRSQLSFLLSVALLFAGQAAAAINNFPAEQASTAPDGIIRPYGTRNVIQARAVNTFPAEEASTAPDGVIRPYP